MATKKEQLTRMSQKHDIEAHWKLAENFIPIAGEIIVYDPDEVYDYARFKCGDGVTKVNDLPFIFKIDKNYATKEYVNDAVANITIEVDSTLTKEGEAADAKAVGDKFSNYETKENVQKITDELAKVKETAEAARTEEEVNAQIDAKVGALELSKTYEPIGAETRAKAYADDLMTDANLDQYATEKEVKDIVDTIVADAVSGDAVTGLANLVEYFHTHGEEAAQMGAAITELEGDVKNLKEAPSAGIKATDISAWNGEIGAKALAATKTTTEEVKTQIEAYDYATKTYVGDAIANIKSIVDVTELPTENIDKDVFYRLPGEGSDPVLVYVNNKGQKVPYLDIFNGVAGFASDGSVTTFIPFHTAKYFFVDELPETGEQIVINTGTAYFYIVKSTGIGYMFLGANDWRSAGAFIFGQEDRGWSKNIDEETVEGVYATYSNFTSSVYNAFDGNKWVSFITEVDKTLSKKGYAADAKTVGDIVSTLYDGADLWVVEGSQVINLSELATAQGMKVIFEVVEELPDTLNPSDPETGIFNAYIVEETGISYINFAGQTMTLGYLMSDGQSQDFDKGWSTDINSETEVGIYCVRKLANIKELTDTVNNLFEAVPGETTHVSNTLTWDGNIDGRTHWEKTTSEGQLSMTAQWVHVSDSIPTYEELTAGFKVVESNGLNRVYDPNEEFHWISITDDENCITLTFNEIGIVLLPRIIKIPHTDSNGVVWEKTGIYFMKYNLTTAEGSDGDYTQSFTIPGYDFTVTAPDKKVIKDELIQIDTTLTQEGKPADAKATGEAIHSIKSTIKDLHTTGAEIWLVDASGYEIQRINLLEMTESNGGIINIDVVDILPETLKQSNMQKGDIYVYIVKSTGIGYGDVGNGITTVGNIIIGGGTLFDKGWTDDVNAETETGVYCVRKIGTPNNGIIDVDNELPEKGKDKSIYRVKREDGYTADLWLRGLNVNVAPVNITKAGIAQGKSITTYIVDKLPDTLEKSSETVMNLYIVDSTGICYLDDGSGIETVGENTFNQKGVDYGWIESVDEITQTGYYCMRVPVYKYTYHIYKDGKWVELVNDTTLFEKVKGATVNVGETLTWDGSTEGKIVIEYNVPDTNGYGIDMHITYVKVSNSIPTYDEIMAGSQVLTVGGNGVGTSSGTFYVVQENDQRITIGHGDGLYATPRIVKTPHTDSNGLTWPEAGVYFTILKVATQDQSNEDRTQSFTITGYDFIVQEPDKNVIKDELIQVDTSLTQEGKAADAKAVGDRLAMLETALGAYIIDIDNIVGDGIETEEEPSEPTPASISFTIAGTSYQAEEGMTWSEWVNSEYNTNGWTDDGEYVYNSFGVDVTFVSTDGTLSGRVTPNETIINGTDYHTRDAG